MNLLPPNWLFLGFIPWFLLPILIIWRPFRGKGINILLRSPLWNHLFFGLAFLLTIATVSQLGESDFGNHRLELLLLVAVIFVGFWRYNSGFLGVRGFCLLSLFWSHQLLTLGRGQYGGAWIIAKLATYAILLTALYLTLYPYRLRDWLMPRHASALRAKTPRD